MFQTVPSDCVAIHGAGAVELRVTISPKPVQNFQEYPKIQLPSEDGKEAFRNDS